LDISLSFYTCSAPYSSGLWYRKKARENKESYMLGSKSLPWYKLGLSDASDMFDISGTMWMVSLCFVYGMKSIWIPWLWPVFNQVFLMMYLSRWLRRSNAATGAEWLATRFGKTGGRRNQFAHDRDLPSRCLAVLAFMAYGFIGLGKFIEIFIPWDLVKGYIPFPGKHRNMCRIFMVSYFTLVCHVLLYFRRHAQHCNRRYDQIRHHDRSLYLDRFYSASRTHGPAINSMCPTVGTRLFWQAVGA
jgi:hypothetical protein